jgi:hypothetical protein
VQERLRNQAVNDKKEPAVDDSRLFSAAPLARRYLTISVPVALDPGVLLTKV